MGGAFDGAGIEVPTSDHSVGSTGNQPHPHPQMLSESHVLHTTKDPIIVLITEDVPKALGAQCQTWDKDPIYILLVVSHNITNNLGEGLHLLKVFTENSFTLGECGREGSIGLNR